MANNIFSFVGLTGGAAGDLDDLIHTNISDGDISIVTIKSTKKTYMFVYDSSSAATEDTAANPIVVVPDSNTSGTGCWIGTAFNGTGIQGSIAGGTILSYIGTSHFATIDDGVEITLATGCLTIPEITTPTADANKGKIYCKSDNKIYFQDGAGDEHEISMS